MISTLITFIVLFLRVSSIHGDMLMKTQTYNVSAVAIGDDSQQRIDVEGNLITIQLLYVAPKNKTGVTKITYTITATVDDGSESDVYQLDTFPIPIGANVAPKMQETPPTAHFDHAVPLPLLRNQPANVTSNVQSNYQAAVKSQPASNVSNPTGGKLQPASNISNSTFPGHTNQSSPTGFVPPSNIPPAVPTQTFQSPQAGSNIPYTGSTGTQLPQKPAVNSVPTPTFQSSQNGSAPASSCNESTMTQNATVNSVPSQNFLTPQAGSSNILNVQPLPSQQNGAFNQPLPYNNNQNVFSKKQPEGKASGPYVDLSSEAQNDPKLDEFLLSETYTVPNVTLTPTFNQTSVNLAPIGGKQWTNMTGNGTAQTYVISEGIDLLVPMQNVSVSASSPGGIFLDDLSTLSPEDLSTNPATYYPSSDAVTLLEMVELNDIKNMNDYVEDALEKESNEKMLNDEVEEEIADELMDEIEDEVNEIMNDYPSDEVYVIPLDNNDTIVEASSELPPPTNADNTKLNDSADVSNSNVTTEAPSTADGNIMSPSWMAVLCMLVTILFRAVITQ